MSLNVSNKLLDLSTSVVVTLETDRLGPRQQTALQRFVRTGVITGRSAPVLVAANILDTERKPYVRFEPYNYISWHNMGTHEDHFWLKAGAFLAAAELGKDSAGGNEYVWRNMKVFRKAVDERQPSLRVWMGSGLKPAVFKSTRFITRMPDEYVVPRVVSFNLMTGVLL
jgi:hypothetical protein